LSFDEAYQGLWEISIAFGLTGMHTWPTWLDQPGGLSNGCRLRMSSTAKIGYLFIYYIIVHDVQNTHIQRKIGLKNIKSNH